MKDLKVTAIEGNSQMLDGGSMFGNAPRAIWEKWTKVDELGRIPLACRALLVETEDTKVLCETGIGAFFEPKMAERFGVQTPHRHRLRENLESLGVHPEQIDFVILSHLHFDHAGGLLPTYEEMQNGKKDIIFSKARFITSRTAFERAVHPHSRDRASFIPGLTDQLNSSGRLDLIEEGQQTYSALPFVRFFQSNGHTPGQLHTQVFGEKSSLVYCGDLVPGKAWVHLPITMGYDRFPEKVIDEKQELYDLILQKNMFLFFTHDSKVAMAHLQKDEKGRYSPIDDIAHPQRMSLS